jgi:hypothetical protein
MEKELFFEIKENTQAINLKEFAPEGAKLDIMVAGKVTGKIKGQTHRFIK